MTTPPAVGWHPDPWGTDKLRWFDGHAWTPHVWPPAEPVEAPPGAVAPGGAMPRTAPAATTGARGTTIVEERSLARWTRLALLWAGPIQAVLILGTLMQFRWLADNWSTLTDPDATVTPDLPGWVSALQPLQLLLLAAEVLFLVWCWKAARFARDHGVPARRRPGWAVGSWFIPVLNLWWPYQSISDMVPSGSPARGRVNRWWALWIAMFVLTFTVAGLAFVSTAAAVVACAVYAVVTVAAAWAARDVVGDVLAEHERLERPSR